MGNSVSSVADASHLAATFIGAKQVVSDWLDHVVVALQTIQASPLASLRRIARQHWLRHLSSDLAFRMFGAVASQARDQPTVTRPETPISAISATNSRSSDYWRSDGF